MYFIILFCSILKKKINNYEQKYFNNFFYFNLLIFLLGSGVWVALSMIAVSAIGMMLFTTRPVGDAMATTIWGTSSSWTLTALPLFVWMGEILFRTKLSENLFKGLSPWLSKFTWRINSC